MEQRLKILLAIARLRPDEDANRHLVMQTACERDGDEVTVKGASGSYPIVREARIEDLDEMTTLVADPERHSSSRVLLPFTHCTVVDMQFNSSQLGYIVGQTTARGEYVLVVREKTSVMKLPRFDQFETDPLVTILEYVNLDELKAGIQAFKTKVRKQIRGSAPAGSKSA